MPIYAVGDGVKTLEDPGNMVGVERWCHDDKVIGKVAREDASENITQVKLTGSMLTLGYPVTMLTHRTTQAMMDTLQEKTEI